MRTFILLKCFLSEWEVDGTPRRGKVFLSPRSEGRGLKQTRNALRGSLGFRPLAFERPEFSFSRHVALLAVNRVFEIRKRIVEVRGDDEFSFCQAEGPFRGRGMGCNDESKCARFVLKGDRFPFLERGEKLGGQWDVPNVDGLHDCGLRIAAGGTISVKGFISKCCLEPGFGEIGV